jgi:hypothetical protein
MCDYPVVHIYLIIELKVEFAGRISNALEALLPPPSNLHLTSPTVTQMAANK